VLSTLLVEFGLAAYFGRALEGLIAAALPGRRRPAPHAFALGIIGGYPVGAKTAISLYQKKLCTKEEAERLLGFCNNSGPAFILGVVGVGVFSSSRIGILLYLVHIFSSITVGFLFRFYKGAGRQSARPRIVTQIEVPAFPSSLRRGEKTRSSPRSTSAPLSSFHRAHQLLVLSGILPPRRPDRQASLPIGFDQAWRSGC
jgi:hypothetical protein